MTTDRVSRRAPFAVTIGLFQLAIFVLFGLYGRVGEPKSDVLKTDYAMFQDTHAMIFIGFGFLMTFLRKYGYSALSINLLLACLTIEWAVLVRGLLSEEMRESGEFSVGVYQLLTADFTAAVVLISMGAVLGKLSPIQYILMTLIEVPAAVLCEHFVVDYLHINDVGGSIVVHTFGAYFGLAFCAVIGKRAHVGNADESARYDSDVTSMIGSLVLFIFWPSFNAAAAATASARTRCIVNTTLSIVASAIATFVFSQLLDKHGRFKMIHIANSALAGGVAMGTAANLALPSFVPLVVGTLAGALSVVGFELLTPKLSRFGVHDTCGVHNLHGMPGVLAGLASIVFALALPLDRLGADANSIYSNYTLWGDAGVGQALRQASGLLLVLIVSVVTGALAALLARTLKLSSPPDSALFADHEYFETPEDYELLGKPLVLVQPPAAAGVQLRNGSSSATNGFKF